MRAKCIRDKAESFSQKHFEIGFTKKSEFNLEVGKVYVVYGVNVWQGISLYLLIGERSDRPSWYPTEAFELVQSSVPSNWYLRMFPAVPSNSVQMILGYDELVNSFETHYSSLIDYQVEALRIFYHRKAEIDLFDLRWSNLDGHETLGRMIA